MSSLFLVAECGVVLFLLKAASARLSGWVLWPSWAVPPLIELRIAVNAPVYKRRNGRGGLRVLRPRVKRGKVDR